MSASGASLASPSVQVKRKPERQAADGRADGSLERRRSEA